MDRTHASPIRPRRRLDDLRRTPLGRISLDRARSVARVAGRREESSGPCRCRGLRLCGLTGRAPTGRPVAPLTQYVLKLVSRCDLACDHCYVYEHPDQSLAAPAPADGPRHGRRPPRERIAEHAAAHRLDAVTGGAARRRAAARRRRPARRHRRPILRRGHRPGGPARPADAVQRRAAQPGDLRRARRPRHQGRGSRSTATGPPTTGTAATPTAASSHDQVAAGAGAAAPPRVPQRATPECCAPSTCANDPVRGVRGAAGRGAARGRLPAAARQLGPRRPPGPAPADHAVRGLAVGGPPAVAADGRPVPIRLFGVAAGHCCRAGSRHRGGRARPGRPGRRGDRRQLRAGRLAQVRLRRRRRHRPGRLPRRVDDARGPPGVAARQTGWPALSATCRACPVVDGSAAAGSTPTATAPAAASTTRRSTAPTWLDAGPRDGSARPAPAPRPARPTRSARGPGRPRRRPRATRARWRQLAAVHLALARALTGRAQRRAAADPVAAAGGDCWCDLD